MTPLTCEYGHPKLCGRPAIWVCYPHRFPGSLWACDQHAPRMVEADQAHRLASAPLLSLPDLKEFVTALAWQSVLLRDSSERVRAENVRFAFRRALEEYQHRTTEALC